MKNVVFSKQSLSNVLGQITISTKLLKTFSPPRPLFDVESSLLQIMIAAHIRTSTQWGGGGGEGKFLEGTIVEKHK